MTTPIDLAIDRLVLNSRRTASGCVEWMKSRSPKGYGRINVDGVIVVAHRFAFSVFVGAIPLGLQVLHRCDNPPCISPVHLWLGTNADNRADSVAKGRPAKGEAHWRAKLTAHAVRAIRYLCHAGWTQKQVGEMFNVSNRTVGEIVRREIWAHVKDEEDPNAIARCSAAN